MGKGSWKGWEPGAPLLTRPQADNTRAGVGNPLLLTGDTLALPTSCRKPCAVPVGGQVSPSYPPGSSSPGVAPSQQPCEATRAGHPVSNSSPAGKSGLRRREESVVEEGRVAEENKVEMRAGSLRGS